MDIEFNGYEHEGTTLIPFDDLAVLRLPITQIAELNEAEAANIALAVNRWNEQKRTPAYGDLITFQYAKSLHLQMFTQVWDWAGKIRTKETNIGVDPFRIQTELLQLFENTKYKLNSLIDRGGSEIADYMIKQFDDPPKNWEGKALIKDNLQVQFQLILIEFAYKLVWIHPFVNGNGRWARIYTNQIADSLKIPRFTWGRSIKNISERRREMLDGLRLVDLNGDLRPYLKWAKK